MAGPLTILTGPSVDYSDEEKKISAASRTIGGVLIGVAAFAVIALTIWACGLQGATGGNQRFSAVMGANLLVGLAAAAAGAVFGFIFGIPRTMSVAERQAMANAMKEAGATEQHQAAMAVNSNLERVSDWLTTLLIGATLVQIKDIAGWVGELGEKLFVANVAPSNDAIVPVIVILFFSLSFLGIYLITRLYLTSALSLLAAGGGRGADTTQDKLVGNLNAAIESGKKEELTTALRALDDTNLPDDVRKNPVLNASRARALAKLISGGDTTGRPEAKGELRAAVENAMADPTVAEELKKDGAKSLATGDAALDQEISAKLNAAGSPASTSKSASTLLTERIDAALASGKAEDVTAAFAAIGEATLSGEEKENAGLNAKIVRLVAKTLQLNVAPDRAKAVDALRDAAQRAAKVPVVADGLREGFDEGSLTTGDTALDDEIKSKLAPA